MNPVISYEIQRNNRYYSLQKEPSSRCAQVAQKVVITPVTPSKIKYKSIEEGNPDSLYTTNLLALLIGLESYFSSFAKLAPLLGPVLLALAVISCAAATLFELVAAARQIHFLNSLSTIFSSRDPLGAFNRRYLALTDQDKHAIRVCALQNRGLCTPEELIELQQEKINKIFEKKLKELARRTDSRTILPLEKSIRSALTCTDPHRLNLIQKQAMSLLETARIQAIKKLALHILGPLALLCSIFLLVLMLFTVTCPHILPLLLILSVITLSISRFFLSKGWLPTQDWSFSPTKAFLPIALQD